MPFQFALSKVTDWQSGESGSLRRGTRTRKNGMVAVKAANTGEGNGERHVKEFT